MSFGISQLENRTWEFKNVPMVSSGTASSPITTSTANTNFLQYYVKNTATSGDNRGLYLRQYLSGAGSGGDCARIFSTVSDVAAATVTGAHISLSFGTTGSITGLGVASRNTLHIPNSSLAAGTYAATQSELYCDGASSDIVSTTTAFHRYIADGNATGIAKIDTSGYLMSIQGLTVGSGKLFQANTAGAASHALRILIGGTPYYIMLTNTGA